MDRAEIVTALTALGRVLSGSGITADLYVVGGAAIALAYDDRRATRDIDAVFLPKIEVYRAADRVAAELDLPAGWLNDAVKGFLLRPDPSAGLSGERGNTAVGARRGGRCPGTAGPVWCPEAATMAAAGARWLGEIGWLSPPRGLQALFPSTLWTPEPVPGRCVGRNDSGGGYPLYAGWSRRSAATLSGTCSRRSTVTRPSPPTMLPSAAKANNASQST